MRRDIAAAPHRMTPDQLANAILAAQKSFGAYKIEKDPDLNKAVCEHYKHLLLAQAALAVR